jgi:hypothetical protein
LLPGSDDLEKQQEVRRRQEEDEMRKRRRRRRRRRNIIFMQEGERFCALLHPASCHACQGAKETCK